MDCPLACQVWRCECRRCKQESKYCEKFLQHESPFSSAGYRQHVRWNSHRSELEQELQSELELPRVDVGNGRGNGAKTASTRGRVSRQQANRSATRGRSAAEF